MRSVGQFLLIAVGLVLVLVLTLIVFGQDPVLGLRAIVEGSLGDKFGVSRTLVRTTPLLLCGLGVLVAWRAGMFNIGGEGQYVVGGLAAAAAAKLLGDTPGFVQLVGALTGGVVAGGMYAALAGWLYVSRGVQVVVSTILLNFVAVELLRFCVRGPLQEAEGQIFQTDRLPREAMLYQFDRQTDLHAGVVLALLVAVIVGIALHWTKAGFKLSVVGSAPEAARSNLIDPGRTQLWAMGWSGALCGLAGAVTYTGVTGRIGDGFAENWGFVAIPVALLGNLTPAGCTVAALWFGGLYAGTEELRSSTPLGNSLVPMLQGAAVLVAVGLRRLPLPRLTIGRREAAQGGDG